MFSKLNYQKILKKYHRDSIDIVELYAVRKEKFALLRHDVEFSLPRALQISKWDSECNFPASVLVQLYCDAYNIFSRPNLDILRNIDALPSSTIGLHLYITHLTAGDWDGFFRELGLQSKILGDCLQRKIDRFSIHRPPQWTLQNRSDSICGMLNFYGESFFEFSPKPQKIKYFADSQHQYKYGNPLENHEFEQVQLLLHPDEWTVDGENTANNFQSLAIENQNAFNRCLSMETKHFQETAK